MRILIVSATASEIRFNTRSDLDVGSPIKVEEFLNHDIDVLVTGIGAVPTAFSLTRFAQDYALVVNIGIAGSYKPNFQIGAVVCVKDDAFGDYGIDDRGTFRSLSEVRTSSSGLISKDEILTNPWFNLDFSMLKLPLVKGLTLSTASGSQEIIDKINKRWNADIETMECASVFYVCNRLGIRFICFRAISNRVEPRDKSKWEIGKAITNLDTEVRNFIKMLP
ncbi:MAG: futalosine hydrolase [Bacteroidales bacterium]|nr:MAG: futalosine hydrolase [Bacteroidales bacterium]